MKTFTVAMGADIPRATAAGHPCVYLVMGAENGSLRLEASPGRAPGLMGIHMESRGAAGDDPASMAPYIADAVRRYGLSGAVLDLPEGEDGFSIALSLCPALAATGTVHYVPASLAPAAEQAKLIIPSAVSGGSFYEMLEHFRSMYPPSRLCLDIVRTRNDFTMPSADPEGTRLSRAEFDERLARAGQSFYSRELCCRYFTYLEGRTPHFVMFDDADTCRAKLELASQAGFFAAFALYSDWGEEISALFA